MALSPGGSSLPTTSPRTARRRCPTCRGRGTPARPRAPRGPRLAGINGAFSFDGVNDRIDIGDSATLDLTGGFTLEAWVYPTATSGWRTVILKEQNNGLTYGLYARENTARPSGWVNTGGVDQSVAGTTALTLNTWTHLVTTFDGSALRLYVNGILVQTSAASGAAAGSTGALRIR